MKVLIDTTILISAALNPTGTLYKAYIKAVPYPNKGILSETNIEELYRIFNRKFPNKLQALAIFVLGNNLLLSKTVYAGDRFQNNTSQRKTTISIIKRCCVCTK